MTDDLIKLAARVEAAEGPSYRLELEIENCLGRAVYVRDPRVGFGDADYERRTPKPYTASLDAAMTLAENSGYAGLLLLAAHNAIAERFARECLTTDEYRTALARAFCAAALRARGAEHD